MEAVVLWPRRQAGQQRVLLLIPEGNWRVAAGIVGDFAEVDKAPLTFLHQRPVRWGNRGKSGRGLARIRRVAELDIDATAHVKGLMVFN